MKAIVVMFDSLNRDALSPYSGTSLPNTPHFQRLAERSARFSACYAGSLPCMPARRELHTGRHNFLHRGWGPLEPFDDSVPRMLAQAGITTHLATDHMHYWEDGGATYHTQYGTYTLVRGQQGDPLHGRVADPEVGESIRVNRSGTWRQDRINREVRGSNGPLPQVEVFDAGLDFIRANADEDSWFVQIETFDPHEPFDSGHTSGVAVDCDWPDYGQYPHNEAVSDAIRNHYKELVSVCDTQLGRVLDMMDDRSLWESTLLIVCTDHGFLLGENSWWGKSAMPWFEKTARTPLFVWDPRSRVRHVEVSEIVQTVDIGPTLLDFFGLDKTPRMHGTSLSQALVGEKSRDVALFGSFGGHVCISDGQYVYMRGPANEGNSPLYEHTLMPMHMRGMFSREELTQAELIPALPFTQGIPVLRIPGGTVGNPYIFGTLLYDLDSDPSQRSPCVDADLELSMATLLWRVMRQHDAPDSQFERLGLPQDGPPDFSHLQCARDRERTESYQWSPPAPTTSDAAFGPETALEVILTHDGAQEVLKRHCGVFSSGRFGQISSQVSLRQAAPALFGPFPWDKFDDLVAELATIQVSVADDREGVSS